MQAKSIELQKLANSYAERLQRVGQVDLPACLAERTEVGRKIVVVAATLQLLYHFSRADALGARSLVQAEVKCIRQAGLKEKDVLPPAIYKRAFEALTSK